MTANALMTTLPRRQQLLALVALVTGLHLILLLAPCLLRRAVRA